VAKTGSARVSLLQDITVVSGIDFQSGLLDLNNNHILLQPAAFLSGESELSRVIGAGGGYIEITADLNAPTGTNPGNLGALISSPQNLGSTVIRRGHSSQVIAGAGGSSILRYYDILPANDVGLNATLRVNYFDNELNGLDESGLVLWKSTDQTHWSNMGSTAKDATANYVEASGLADLSRWTVSTVSNPLPVKITSFTVECLNGNALVRWATAQEENSSRFEVEKSLDGRQWQTISQMAAAGSSSVERDYAFTDVHAAGGTAFYRVVEVDLDGSMTYSTVASDGCGVVSDDAGVNPNPVRDICWVTLNARGASAMKIELFDATGVRRLTQIAALNEGNNRIGVDVRGLAPGVYFIHLQWENGRRTKIVSMERN
jgi:hypothetical protein